MPIYYVQYPRQSFIASSDVEAFREVADDVESLLREDDTCDGTHIHRIYRGSSTPVSPAIAVSTANSN